MQDRFNFRCVINNAIKDVYYFYELPDDKYILFACTDFENGRGYQIEKKQLIQCTGKKDKHKNLIFEGDRVYIGCEDEIATIKWSDDLARFTIHFEDVIADFDNYYGKELEVIGNIYEDKQC